MKALHYQDEPVKLCKREGCPARYISQTSHCLRHEPRMPWGETNWSFVNRVNNNTPWKG